MPFLSTPQIRAELSVTFPAVIKFDDRGFSEDFNVPDYLPGRSGLLHLHLQGKSGLSTTYLILEYGDVTLVNPDGAWSAPLSSQPFQHTRPQEIELSDIQARSAIGATDLGSLPEEGISLKALTGTIHLDENGQADVMIGGGFSHPLSESIGPRTAVALPVVQSFSAFSAFAEDNGLSGEKAKSSESAKPSNTRPTTFDTGGSQLSGKWYEPQLTTKVSVGRLALGLSVELADPPLQTAGRLTWSGPDSSPRYLVFDNDKQRQVSKNLFLAGIIAGIFGGILVEIVFAIIKRLRNRTVMLRK